MSTQRYRIEKELGRGSYGVVELVKDRLDADKFKCMKTISVGSAALASSPTDENDGEKRNKVSLNVEKMSHHP